MGYVTCMRERARLRHSPACPRCNEPMELFRVLPELGGRPKLEIFVCPRCHELETRAPDIRQKRIDWEKLLPDLIAS